MIEQKINAGEYLDFGDIAPSTQQPDAGQISVNWENRNINASRWGQGEKRTIRRHERITKVHRNFIWLPFADNAINYVETAGRDVLSGPFSGCYLVLYNYNGNRRVAHIATPGAKADWNALVAHDPNIALISGFLPHNGIANPMVYMNPAQENEFTIFGLITTANNLYAILTFTRANSRHNRIAAVTPTPSLPMATLLALP